MSTCLFVSDLHGHVDRYEKLFLAIEATQPSAVFLGGDLLPSGFNCRQLDKTDWKDFILDIIARGFQNLRDQMRDLYPQVFLILGNDDRRCEEAAFIDAAARGLWNYVHNHITKLGNYYVYGYAYVPPTPFQLKDWERYDVSRYVDPGCISPEEGGHSIPIAANEIRYATIQNDLEQLAGESDMEHAIFLFHTPPYQTYLDRAALDGKMVDHVSLDVHVGSIAVRRFIETRQPLLTLHGHIHESARLTGSWQDKIGRTTMYTAAHDGPELALIQFDLENLATATRELL